MPLPSRRHPVRGTDLDGNEIELVHSIARKLYVCPSCRGSLEIGTEHVLVRRWDVSGERYHQHWHTECAVALARELDLSAGR